MEYEKGNEQIGERLKILNLMLFQSDLCIRKEGKKIWIYQMKM